MVTLKNIIQRIRKARRTEAPPPTRRFETYKPQYSEFLETVDDLGGPVCVNELATWMIDRTHETGSLPEPTAVCSRAREICLAHDCEIPADSPLNTSASDTSQSTDGTTTGRH